MVDKDIKKEEQKAFWIGLGTIVAIICLLIGFSTLIFAGSNDEEKTTQPETKQEASKGEEAEEKEPTKKEEQTEQEKPQQPEETASQEESQEEQGSSGSTYEVQSGDSLYSIGLEFNVDWQDIGEANDLSEDDTIQVGDELIIPSQ